MGHSKEGLAFGLYSGGLALDNLRQAVEAMKYGSRVMEVV